MKIKSIVTALIALSVSAFASANYGLEAGGKKFMFDDDYNTLVKKLGEPSTVSQTYASWRVNGAFVEAYFNGVQPVKMNINNKGSVTVDGYKVTLGVDTVTQAAKKFQNGCYTNMEPIPDTYSRSFTTRAGAEGEIYVEVTTEAPSMKASTLRGIKTISLSYDEPFINGKCIGN